MTSETVLPINNIQTNLDSNSNENITKVLEKLLISIRCIAKIVLCKCGCGKTRLDRDERGNLRQYITRHHSQLAQPGELNHPSWKLFQYS
jgi:hypothetical protein